MRQELKQRPTLAWDDRILFARACNGRDARPSREKRAVARGGRAGEPAGVRSGVLRRRGGRQFSGLTHLTQIELQDERHPSCRGSQHKTT